MSTTSAPSNLHNPSLAVEQLLAIDRNDLLAWRRNVAAAPRSLFVLTDDHERLLARLRPPSRPPSAPC
jgi:hypothetical protein